MVAGARLVREPAWGGHGEERGLDLGRGGGGGG